MKNKQSISIILSFLLALTFCTGEKPNTQPQKTLIGQQSEVSSTPANTNQIDLPAGITCLLKSYPDFIDSFDSRIIYLKDGTKLIWDDGISKSTFDELLNNASPKDMMSQCYKPGKSYKIPIDENYDPGRIRHEPFFYKMYGANKSEVQKNLVTIDWFGRKLKVTKINSVNKRLDSVKNELTKLPEDLHKYFTKTAGTFNYRNIAGTERVSVHSFGIAIDLNTEYSHYWRWQKPDSNGKYKYINKMPLEIVEIFEKYGFIWGGKWYHFDTMHFEYRPELLMEECTCKE
jgi:peptidoglycan LD-endopeptidase CwlK